MRRKPGKKQKEIKKYARGKVTFNRDTLYISDYSEINNAYHGHPSILLVNLNFELYQKKHSKTVKVNLLDSINIFVHC